MFYVLTIFYFIPLGLDEYTTYSVSVAANNSLGIGPYSRPVEVKTLESSKSILLLFFVDLIGCTTCYIVYAKVLQHKISKDLLSYSRYSIQNFNPNEVVTRKCIHNMLLAVI